MYVFLKSYAPKTGAFLLVLIFSCSLSSVSGQRKASTSPKSIRKENAVDKRSPSNTVVLQESLDSIPSQRLTYWNEKSLLLPWRPFVSPSQQTRLVDIDLDGDPDLLFGRLQNQTPFCWIDDDDDMKWDDLEGDMDSDCLLIDKNKDGIYAGPRDISFKWGDENKDGKADIQLIVSNGGTKVRNFYDWDGDYMFVMDTDGDGIMHYFDWRKIAMQAWEHIGHANFFEDYHGNSLFLKMHASSFRIHDLRYNWENPFIFYDQDQDGLTEMAIRLVNTPSFRTDANVDQLFDGVDTAHDVVFNGKIDYVSIAWDLDNDNAPGNEFDFDLSLLYKGPGFSYQDQRHEWKSLKGLPETDSMLYDARWRQLDHLYYPDEKSAWDLIFQKGIWKQFALVFDEDDDCNRWERVEFLDPLDPYKNGKGKGGVDNNAQADAVGDRGEWDLDGSGNGQLYTAKFDGRLHLFGADKGVWTVDQTAFSFQGFGGLYDRWRPERLQTTVTHYPVFLYSDQNKNGFFDFFSYDLDGDGVPEDSLNLLQLGVNDQEQRFHPVELNDLKGKQFFSEIADQQMKSALQWMEIAQQVGVPVQWYQFYTKPLSVHQKYDFGFWLKFYLWNDLKQRARQLQLPDWEKEINKAYARGSAPSPFLYYGSTIPLSSETVRQLYFEMEKKSGSHFVLTGPETFIKLKEATKNDSKVNQALQQSIQLADQLIQKPLLTYYLDDAKLRIPSLHQFTGKEMPDLMYAYKITGNRKYADRWWAQIEQFLNYPDWGVHRHFLDAGVVAFAMAYTYEQLSDYLTPAQKKKLYQGTRKLLLEPAFKQMHNRNWWHTIANNWNGICNGGVMVAALAMMNEDPSFMSELVAMAAKALPTYLRTFEPEGQSEEGMMYWGYGWMYTALALEALQNKLGTTGGLLTIPAVQKSGWFPILASGPVTGLSIGDDPLKQGPSQTMLWFAYRFQDKLLYDVSLQSNFSLSQTWHNLLFYPGISNPIMTSSESLENQSLISLKPSPDSIKKSRVFSALQKHIPGLELFILRSGWDKEAVFASLHGGKNNASHGHLDAGSFDLQWMGEVWAYGGLGSDKYTFPGYFSKETLPAYQQSNRNPTEPGRWHFYRMRAEGKNCLVVNPDFRPDQDPFGSAHLMQKKENGWALDLQEPYRRDLTYYRRALSLLHPPSEVNPIIHLEDHAIASTPMAQFYWNMHTKAKIEILADGKSAVLQQNGKSLYLYFLSQSPIRLEVTNADYLADRNFPLTSNSPNTGFKKLVASASTKEWKSSVVFSVHPLSQQQLAPYFP